MPSAPAAPTPPAVAVPKAPHAPDVEDVLGPPPHAPRIGGRGHALSGVRSLGHAPRVGHTIQPTTQRQQPATQRVIIQQAPQNPALPTPANVNNAAQPAYQAPHGMGRKPARPRKRAAAQNRQQAAAAVAPLAHAPAARPAVKLHRTDLGEGDVENATKSAYQKLKPESETVREGYVKSNTEGQP